MIESRSVSLKGENIIEQFENYTFPEHENKKIIEFLMVKNAEFIAKNSLGLSDKDVKDLTDFYQYFMPRYGLSTREARMHNWGREAYVFRLAENILGIETDDYWDEEEVFEEDDDFFDPDYDDYDDSEWDEDVDLEYIEESERPAKYNLWISDDFYEDPDSCERPVILGFSPEEREWAKQERPVEEIIRFVQEYENPKLLQLLEIAYMNNDVGFDVTPCGGDLVKRGDKFYLVSDEPDMWEYELEDVPEDLYAQINPHNLICYIIDEKDRKHVFASESDDYAHEMVMNAFLECAHVKSFRSLAKILNKGWKFYLEDISDYEPDDLPF